MAGKLEISIPTVAHIVITGVSPGVHSVVMQRIKDMLTDDFGATVSAALPAGPAGSDDDVGKSLWVVSQA